MRHELAHRVDALGLAELDLALLLEVADQLDHVEGVDAERLERGLLGDGLGVEVEVLDEHFFDGVDGSHDGFLSVVQFSLIIKVFLLG